MSSTDSTKNKFILSICIPSYNRPEQLAHLLETIDCDSNQVEIVICEDAAPRREDVRKVVSEFRQRSKYKVVYEENKTNLGYDGNIRRLIELAGGTFIMFMGDDDWFPAGALDKYLNYLRKNTDVGYILRSYLMPHPDGTLEPFRYLPASRRLPAGPETCAWLYKRSVTLCGVTFKRESALRDASSEFDGTLLYQLHLVLEVALREPSVYCDFPVAVGAQSYRQDKPLFGAASAESGRYQPGTISFDNSINFTRGYFEISGAFDKKHGLNITESIRRDLSKYSYPFLSIQRKRGRSEFLRYAVRLARETRINQTWHYYFYTVMLWFLGEYLCDKGILCIKRLIGRTPQL